MPDFDLDNSSDSEFEESVRQVARKLYVSAYHSGSLIVDGRERDEIIDTGTELIVIEATRSRKLQKTRSDFDKSVDLIKALRKNPNYSDYNFRILLVTSEAPTADQNTYVKEAKSGCPKEYLVQSALFETFRC